MRWAVNLRRVWLVVLIMTGMVTLIACKKDDDDNDEDPGDQFMKIIETMQMINETPLTFEKVEWALIETEGNHFEGLNPFNYNDIHIKATIVDPDEVTRMISAFWYQDYEIILNESWTQPPTGISGVPSTNPNEPQGLEMVQFEGDAHYRMRYLPTATGKHTYVLEVYVEGALVQVEQGSFDVASGSNTYRGTIQVEPTHRRNFVFDNGDTFIPIGQNLGWYTSSTRQTRDYDVWFDLMQENHANFTRIWMSTWTFALHWGEKHDDFSTRQSAAARLDRVVDLAAEYDIYYMLALINHGQFSAIVNPLWIHNPWNEANGGPLAYPSQFFTLHEARETYKHQLTYILARYGYSTHLMAWELWNEVDWTDGFNSAAVYIWHNEMAQHVKAIDPYQRMVTTSYKGHTGTAYALNAIDFANPHSYDYPSRSMNVHLPPLLNNLFNQYNKPILQSEIGINWRNGRDTTLADPTGISLKQAQWAGVMGGGAGGAMNWWWDSWVHTSDLYYRFKGIGLYALEMDMVGERYDQLASLSGVQVTNQNVGILGYRVDDRVYGYLYDKAWHHQNPVSNEKETTVTIPLENGTYTLRVFNTDTGEIINTSVIQPNQGQVVFTLSLVEDSAFIITRGE